MRTGLPGIGPLTREKYLEYAYFGNPPDELSAEQEAELPPEFRKRDEDEAQSQINKRAARELGRR